MIMKYLFFIFVLLICNLAHGQTIIVQPVVCSSNTENSSVVVPTVPIIEHESLSFQCGFITFAPGEFDAGIDGVITDSNITAPFYDGNMLYLSAFDSKRIINIYSIEGKNLACFDTKSETIDISSVHLPNVFILVIDTPLNKYTFKYSK